MRKIEQQMMRAINAHKSWQGGNTVVAIRPAGCVSVYLHGNHIADFNNSTGALMVNVDTLRQWATPTTKSRLRALGANVATRRGITYLDNIAI